jgi:hypothetical protein
MLQSPKIVVVLEVYLIQQNHSWMAQGAIKSAIVKVGI